MGKNLTDRSMSPMRRFLLTLALTAMWSPSFLFIKLAVQDLPPITVAALRVTIAALILYGILRWKRYVLPGGAIFWFHATVVGLFSAAIPFCLFCYAERTIDSSLAAILNGTAPMFTALLAQFFVPSDRLNIQKAVGIILCTGGLVFLFASDIQRGMIGSVYGMLAATAAAFCYGVNHIYGKKYITGYPPFVAPTAALIVSALALWPLALGYEHPFSLPAPSFSSILGVCGLAVFGTVSAFIFYYKLLEESGPVAISLVACFFPVGGLLLGVIFLGEAFTLSHLLAAALILLGMCIVNQVVRFKYLGTKNQ